MDIPGSFSGSVSNSSWTQLNSGGGVYLHWSDYNAFVAPGEQLYARFCMIWTDTGGQGYHVSINIDQTVTGSLATFDFKNTYSSQNLWHSECGTWVPTSQLTCTPGWSSGACLFQVEASPAEPVQVNKMWMEIAVNK